MVFERMIIYYGIFFTNGSQPHLNLLSGSCSINSQKCVDQSRSAFMIRLYKSKQTFLMRIDFRLKWVLLGILSFSFNHHLRGRIHTVSWSLNLIGSTGSTKLPLLFGAPKTFVRGADTCSLLKEPGPCTPWFDAYYFLCWNSLPSRLFDRCPQFYAHPHLWPEPPLTWGGQNKLFWFSAADCSDLGVSTGLGAGHR